MRRGKPCQEGLEAGARLKMGRVISCILFERGQEREGLEKAPGLSNVGIIRGPSKGSSAVIGRRQVCVAEPWNGE